MAMRIRKSLYHLLVVFEILIRHYLYLLAINPLAT